MKKIFAFTSITCLLCLNAFSKIITVSNNANSPGQYTSIQAADTAASDNDTILVSGSPVDYGLVTIDKKLVLYGQGYDPRKDVAFPTSVSQLLLTSSASGSIISGFVTSISVNTNLNIIVNNITITRCTLSSGIIEGVGWLFRDDIINGFEFIECSNIIFQNNIIEGFIEGDQNGSEEILFNNNYFIGLTPIYDINNATVTNNVFYYKSSTIDTFSYLTSSNNCVFNNNIYFNSGNSNPFQIGLNNNTGTGNINADPKFVNINLTDPGNPIVTRSDDFHLQSGSPGINAGTDGTNIGPEGGTVPMQYPYSGEPAIPQIKTMNMNSYISPSGTLKVTFTAKGNN